jgi:hypothetical protein
MKENIYLFDRKIDVMDKWTLLELLLGTEFDRHTVVATSKYLFWQCLMSYEVT